MSSSRNVSIFVLAVISLCIAGSGFLVRRHVPEASPNVQRAKELQSRPSATIDARSLVATSTGPTIMGTATDIQFLTVIIYPTGDRQFDYGAYGISQGLVKVRDGRWSFQVGGEYDLGNSGIESLSPGQYRVELREYTGDAPQGAQGLAWLISGKHLTDGILQVSDTQRRP